MRGLFGVDGVLCEGAFWPVEVNPRYTASVEVLERATGLRAFAWQAGDVSPPRSSSPRPPVGGALSTPLTPNPSPPTAGRGGPEGGLTPPARQCLVGKAVLYAQRDVVVPGTGWPGRSLRRPGSSYHRGVEDSAPATQEPDFADLPHPGDRIAAGRPILTLFAE